MTLMDCAFVFLTTDTPYFWYINKMKQRDYFLEG